MSPLAILLGVAGAAFGWVSDRIAARWPEHEDSSTRAVDWRTLVVAGAGAVALAAVPGRFEAPIDRVVFGAYVLALVLLGLAALTAIAYRRGWQHVVARNKLLTAFIVLAMISFRRKSVPLKFVTFAFAIGYMGFAKSYLISITNVFSVFDWNWPVFRYSLAWYLFFAFTVVSTILWGRLYCGRVCAYGALTQSLDAILHDDFGALRTARRAEDERVAPRCLRAAACGERRREEADFAAEQPKAAIDIAGKRFQKSVDDAGTTHGITRVLALQRTASSGEDDRDSWMALTKVAGCLVEHRRKKRLAFLIPGSDGGSPPKLVGTLGVLLTARS